MAKLNYFAIFLLLLCLGLKGFSQNAQTIGSWSPPISFDVVPVAVANLPDGRLLSWSSKYHDDFGGNDGFTFTQIFDPASGSDGAVLPTTVTQTRMSSATHSVNNEQRRASVTSTTSNSKYQLNMPNENIMASGYYMPFGDANGVPSMSESVLVGPVGSKVKEENLLVEFDFSEGVGTLVTDSSGKNNHGEIKERDNSGNPIAPPIGNYWTSDGFAGSALEMDGMEHSSNSLVEVPTSTSLAALTDEITVMAWVNRNTGSIIPQNGQIPNVAIFAHDYSSFFFGYHNSMYKLEFRTDAGALASCYTGAYNPGEWDHVVGTYDGAHARLYVNGAIICEDAVTGNLRINTTETVYSTFTLSGFYDKRSAAQLPSYSNASGITDELDGRLDKFKLYNVALTVDEILSIYNEERDLVDIILTDNIALNKPTSQSSTGWGGPSFKAVDGNTNGVFNNTDTNAHSVTHTADGDTSAWWRVDLGDAFDLSAIRIFNRTDCCSERLAGAIVYVGNTDSTTPSDYTQVGVLTADSSILLSENLGTGRYIMIRQTGILSLAEVEVYGISTSCSVAGTACDDGNPDTVNDIEDGDCNCSGVSIICEELAIAYEINNGPRESGAEAITVSAGDNIGLFLNFEGVDYTVTDPFGNVLSGNTVNNITVEQGGEYSLNSTVLKSLQTAAPVIVYVDSEELTDEIAPISNVLDGNPNTYWHTEWATDGQATDPGYPHEIHFDMGANATLSGFSYLPRQTGGVNGRIGGYEIYISNATTPSEWGAPVDSGTWTYEGSDSDQIRLRTITFAETQGRYLRFVATSPAIEGQPWASAAEINVLRALPTVITSSVSESTNPASNALDGNPATFWHTQYTDTTPGYPHFIDIDIGVESNLSGIEYLPRQTTGILNGTIAEFEIYVSNSTTNWGEPVASGSWAYNAALKSVNFSEKQGRYVRLRALSEGGGNAWASAAEIRPITTLDITCVHTIEINVDPIVTYTYAEGVWTPGDPSGAASANDSIVINSGHAFISDTTICNTILIEPGAALTVNSGATVTAFSTTLNSESILYSSLIVEGELIGVVGYKLYVNEIGTAAGGGNDLIASPVESATFNNAFVVTNPNLPMHPTRRGEFAFAPYDVDLGAYVNFNIGDNREGIFAIPSGIGYRAATETGSNLTFTGAATVSNVDVAISGAPAGRAWNLIGNPYPSYLDVAEFFTTNNRDQLNSEYIAIYGYTGSKNSWNILNSATTGPLLAPGQGFFVKSKTSGGSIQFTPSMRRAGTTDDFILGRQQKVAKALSKLKLSSATEDVTTSVYFIEGTTRGLDPGYDAAAYSATAVDFAIFTNLLEDHTGLDIAIQSLPYNDFNDVIVPLGIKAKAGVELSISIDTLSTLPFNINVYLEDTQNNTLTLLNNSVFKFTPTTAMKAAGRFKVHYSAKTLSVEDLELTNDIRIYTTKIPKTLVINGQLSASTALTLYDIQGRVVLSEILTPNIIENSVNISTISTGVYVVKIVNENQFKTQKLMIK